MKRLSLYLITILLFTSLDLYSQNSHKKYNFDHRIKQDEGEVNGQQLYVRVAVDMDIKADERPMRLQIFVSQPKSNKWNLVVSNTSIIESMYPAEKGGKHNGNTIPDFFIEKGILQMVTDINNRKSRYSFKFKNNNFELFNIARVVYDGKNTTSETHIDLLAGTKIEFDQELGSDKILNKKKKSIKFTALPKIQDLKYADLEKY